MTTYAEKKAQLEARLASANGAAGVSVRKDTSNLFRDRGDDGRRRIDLSHFNCVLRVDAEAGIVEAEGMTTYETLADATLASGTVPAVVPQLKSITLGGAVAGVGIEASSFRHGLVHDTITSVDVLTGAGQILTCTPENEHRDLFHGLANSYGTLGYALKLSARTVPARRCVELRHERHQDPVAYFARIGRLCAEGGIDFLDGVVFSRDELYLTLGRFIDDAREVSDYGFERIYYRSIRERQTDALTTRDFLWRWDTDWFWCSKNVGAQHPLIRRLLGRRRLNSITYQKIMRWNARHGVTRLWNRLRGTYAEPVIQDVDIPIGRAAEFLAFLHAEVGILPIWICPIRAPAAAQRATLYPLAQDSPSVNFGFWDVVTTRESRPAGCVNRAIERKVTALGGVKSLYSDSYFTEDEFWSIYDRDAYAALKRKYDPEGALGDLYAKCVRHDRSDRASGTSAPARSSTRTSSG